MRGEGVNMFAIPDISLYVLSSLPKKGAHEEAEVW